MTTETNNETNIIRPKDWRRDIERKAGILSPEMAEQYGEVEDFVSKQFLRRIGDFLRPEQREYFLQRRIVVTSHELADLYGQESGNEVANLEDAAIEGLVYTGYTIGGPYEEDATTQQGDGSTVRYFGEGQFALYPLAEDELYAIHPRWLINDRVQDKWESLTALSEGQEEACKQTWNSLGPIVYSSAFAHVAVHEKVHGIQDHDLPLPLLEASAHYYHRQVARENDWNAEIISNMRYLADLFGEFLEEQGNDVHRLIFGNLSEPRRSELLRHMKEKFNNQTIQRLSEYNEFNFEPSDHHIFWEITPLEVAQRDQELDQHWDDIAATQDLLK